MPEADINVLTGTGALGQPVWQPVTETNGLPTKNAQYTPVTGSQYGLSVTTLTTLTVPTGAAVATVIVEGSSVRYSTTGTPTATSGMLLAAGGPYTFNVPLSSLTFIATSGSSTTIDVEYFK